MIDVSDPTAPAQIGEAPMFGHGELDGIEIAGDFVYVALDGDLAYVANSTFGLQVVGIADPGSPVALGSAATPGLAKDVAVAGGFAFVAADGAGLQVFDVGNSAAPFGVGGTDTPRNAVGVALSCAFAFVCDRAGGLRCSTLRIPPCLSSSRTYRDPPRPGTTTSTVTCSSSQSTVRAP